MILNKKKMVRLPSSNSTTIETPRNEVENMLICLVCAVNARNLSDRNATYKDVAGKEEHNSSARWR
jgi:hypothetical protein